MTNQEQRQHEIMHQAMNTIAPIEAHFGPKPDDYAPLSPESVGPITASMQFENVARNMGAQVMQLEHEVTHDKLTNAQTKQACHDALEKLITEGKNPHVFYLDFNHFKSVNDWAGHQAGDQTLIMITASLLENLRPGEVLYRVGGDEFIIIKDPTVAAQDRRNSEQPTEEMINKRSGKERREEDDSVEGVKKRIKYAFDQTVEPLIDLLGEDLVAKMGISVGHAEHEEGQSIEDLIATADYEMYIHKDEIKKAQAEADNKNNEDELNKDTEQELPRPEQEAARETTVVPGLNNEELVQRYQAGDERALEALIDRNMRLIYKVANQSSLRALVQDSGVLSEDDLVQVGRTIIWDCAKKFKHQPDQGSFYAYVERALKSKMTQMTTRYTHPLYTMPSNAYSAGYASQDKEYADRSDSAARGLQQVRRSRYRVRPLDTVISQGQSKSSRSGSVYADDTKMTSMTIAPQRDLFEDVESRIDSAGALDKQLSNLTVREQAVIESRLGLDDGKRKGRVEAAAAIGLQLDKFTKTEKSALRKLRVR